jgi:hypothetical protein
MRSSPRFLAPDWYDRLGKVPGAAWLLVAVFLTIMVLRDPRGNGWLATLVVVALVVGGPTALKRLNTRIIITQELVICRDALRRVQQCKRIELARLVVVRVQVLGPKFPLTRVLMLDHDGRVCASLQVDAWSDDQLSEIYRDVGLPVLEHPMPLSPRKANTEFPGATSVALRYWPVLGGAAVLASIVIIGTLASLFGR